jgi:hypothetical protein
VLARKIYCSTIKGTLGITDSSWLRVLIQRRSRSHRAQSTGAEGGEGLNESLIVDPPFRKALDNFSWLFISSLLAVANVCRKYSKKASAVSMSGLEYAAVTRNLISFHGVTRRRNRSVRSVQKASVGRTRITSTGPTLVAALSSMRTRPEMSSARPDIPSPSFRRLPLDPRGDLI